MKNLVLILIFGLFFTNSWAQKVATYSTGTTGEENYESFGFWVNNEGEKDFITYNYGKDKTEAKITYAGLSNFKGVPCFKIQFANKLQLFVMINGNQLQIADNSGKYLKTFKWEYEGPINGIGTYCNVCASDENEAILITKKFMN
ncbi:hypothetical protein [Pedobacter flavus]|uniref:Uncharacterized protein n=1 Tax=Pedobacter flavus TaxID=3113906 RepID=A0ABU7H5B8_9SPHI|nr:hypothetical protein [Pedobacter sp. VNH31]MEE1885751.1 hypothetical protein [Pedobacter sp. VNH31]